MEPDLETVKLAQKQANNNQGCTVKELLLKTRIQELEDLLAEWADLDRWLTNVDNIDAANTQEFTVKIDKYSKVNQLLWKEARKILEERENV